MGEEKNTIYHYCSIDTFYSIISNKTIRLSDVSKTNDYKEKNWAYKKILKVFSERLLKDVFFTDRWKKIIENIYKQLPESTLTLAACFSKNGDLLSEWTKYAKDGSGVALGFNSDILTFGENDHRIFKSEIIYSEFEQDKKINEIVQSFLTEIDLSNRTEEDIESILFNKVFSSLDNISSTMKNPAFKEEDEIRIIYPVNINLDKDLTYRKDMSIKDENISGTDFQIGEVKYRVKDENLILYSDLSFKNYIDNGLVNEIILGPKCKLNEADIMFFLNSENYKGKINIKKSEASYT